MSSTSHEIRRPFAIWVVLSTLFLLSCTALYGIVLEFTDAGSSSVLDSADREHEVISIIIHFTGHVLMLGLFGSFVGVLLRVRWGRWLSVLTLVLYLFIIGGVIATDDEISVADKGDAIILGIAGGVLMLPAAITLVILIFDRNLKQYFLPSIDEPAENPTPQPPSGFHA